MAPILYDEAVATEQLGNACLEIRMIQYGLKPRFTLPITMLLAGSCLAGSLPSVAATSPSRPAAKPAALARVASLPGLRYLPAHPSLIAAVQVSAVQNFLGMMTGGQSSEASGADALVGIFDLLKDQMDGPLTTAAYLDATGKSGAFVMAAHLKQAALTRELMNGALTLGGDEKSPTQKSTYRGQTLLTAQLPKAQMGNLPITLQPTFTITDTDFLLVGTTLAVVKQALDTGAVAVGGLASRSDVVAMMRQFPPDTGADVWLFMPKPTGKLALPGKSPLPIPIASLPIGATVATLRFTPTGVRFEGLASVDRAKTAKAP
jgi:hypothetical protein